MRLLVAWIASALAGFVAERFGTLIAVAIPTWKHLLHWTDVLFILRVIPASVYAYAFVVFLILQLAYGGLLYLVLTRLGLFNLPLVLLAYLVPIAGFALMDIGAPARHAIPVFTAGTALAVVGWFVARPPKA
jgi:hypothetical protein